MTKQVSNDPQTVQIGQRIREIRKRKGLTLKQVGELTGISIPYLSQIENGRVDLNVTNLQALSRALDVPLVTFFIDGTMPGVSVTRRAERRWLELGDSASESLLVKTYSNLEIFTIRLQPNSGATPLSNHPGEEFTYVIRGAVQILLKDHQVYHLQEGDIIYYLSTIPHQWQNAFADEAEILVVNTPATY